MMEVVDLSLVIFGIGTIGIGILFLGYFAYVIISGSYHATDNRREPKEGEIKCHGCGGSGGLFAGLGIVPCFCCDGTGVAELPLTKDHVDRVSALIKAKAEVSRG